MDDYSMPSGTKKLRFRDWLKQKLDNREITGLEWIDRRQGLFKIPWKHGSLHGWSLQEDNEVFRQWAIHSGRYKSGMKADPSKWETYFRCTLNALSDFKEVKPRSCTRGMKAHKIYIMKGGYRKAEQREKADGDQTEPLDLSDKEIIQIVDDMMGAPQKPILNRRPNSAFEALVVDKPRELFTVSFTPWYLAAWNALAVDQYVNKPEKKEDDVPNDQEIIDLVDQMSEQGNSSLEDLDGVDGTNEEVFAQDHSDKWERPPLRLVMKTEGSSTFVNEYAASLPLKPDSTREILNAISRF